MTEENTNENSTTEASLVGRLVRPKYKKEKIMGQETETQAKAPQDLIDAAI